MENYIGFEFKIDVILGFKNELVKHAYIETA